MTTKNKRQSEDKAKTFTKLKLYYPQISTMLSTKLVMTSLKTITTKYPTPRPFDDNTLMHVPVDIIIPSSFDSINEGTIFKSARLTKVACGPSQLKANQYCHILTSTKYKKENKELREQISILAGKIASEILDPNSLESFTSCHLIPLNKNRGVRPIELGDVLRRIFGKSMGT